MKITDVEAITIGLREKKKIADSTQDALIIKVHTDEGIIGIGEADTSPHIGRAVVEAPVSGKKCQGLRQLLLGKDPFDVETIWDEMYFKSYKYGRKGVAVNVMSGIDLALWDIIGKATNKPVYQLLGGAFKKKIEAYASALFPEHPEDLQDIVEKCRQFKEKGFSAIKFGWGSFGDNRAVDYQLIKTAREELGEDIELMIDVGMKWDAKTTIQRAELLKEFRPYWLEEPVPADDLVGYRQASRRVTTRIVGGEEEYTLSGFYQLITEGGVDGIQPDLARSGGITICRKLAALAQLHSIPVIPHGWSTDILVKANLHYIAATKNSPYLEYCMAQSPLRWEVTTNPSLCKEGWVEVPEEPGLGIHLNEDTLEKYRIDPLEE